MAHFTTYNEMLLMLKRIQELKNANADLDEILWDVDRLVENAKERKNIK